MTRVATFFKKRAWLALVGVVLLAVVGVGIGKYLPFPSHQPRTVEYTLKASTFSYSPERIRVNKGDNVVVKLQPQDVTHGFYLDGYNLETHASPGEEATLKFVANTPGQFRFRCSQTCGPLHPFMVGEMNVESGTPYTNTRFLGTAVAALVTSGGATAFVWRRKGTSDGSSS